MIHRSEELGWMIKMVDESVQLLNQCEEECSLEKVRMVSKNVEWSLERLVGMKLSPLHEVVYFLELACFSLLNREGEFFSIYLSEVNQRYRLLLGGLQERE